MRAAGNHAALEAKAYARCLVQVTHRDALEVRARGLLRWIDGCAVAAFPHSAPPGLESALPCLLDSRLLSGFDLQSLTVVTRSSCRTLGSIDVLRPLLCLVLHGLTEVRHMVRAADECLGRGEAVATYARQRLTRLTKPQLSELRVEQAAALPVRPARYEKVLELASMLLQPNEKAHDSFALNNLARDAHLVERAVSFRPERMNRVQQQRFQKLINKQRELFEVLRCHQNAGGALAEWLLSVGVELDERANVCSIHCVKEAVIPHITALAHWVLRPHQGQLLGRPVPPPVLAGVDLPQPPAFNRAAILQTPAVHGQPSRRPQAPTTPRTRREIFALAGATRPKSHAECYPGMPALLLSTSERGASAASSDAISARSSARVHNDLGDRALDGPTSSDPLQFQSLLMQGAKEPCKTKQSPLSTCSTATTDEEHG